MCQTVMIADDSMPMHTLIAAHFSADNLSFHSVYDGSSAVSAAASLQPDLILLDLDMPGMDGFEACQKIKADPATAAIPVMFLSGNSVAADKRKAMALGAMDYVEKPFQGEALRERVRSTLVAANVRKEKIGVDPLTGLWNRSSFDAHLREQFLLAQLASKPLACVVTSIDQIVFITSRYGPSVANQVVRKVAAILAENVGAHATACCLPDRRFALLFRGQDRSGASRLAGRLRKRLAQTMVLNGGLQINLTCSFGVCDSLISEASQMFERAIHVAIRASDRGGNCVAVARAAPSVRV